MEAFKNIQNQPLFVLAKLVVQIKASIKCLSLINIFIMQIWKTTTSKIMKLRIGTDFLVNFEEVDIFKI